jgi:hypothetical protein
MFEKFGNFNSAEEINLTAVNLRTEGDMDSIRELAGENGIDEEIAEVFIEGELGYLCDGMSAALGKLDVECKELKPQEIMMDWVEYIRSRCSEDIQVAAAVRRKDKSLRGCITAILKWSFDHQIPVDEDIRKKAGVNQRCTMGTPGMGTVKKIITNYYLGK